MNGHVNLIDNCLVHNFEPSWNYRLITLIHKLVAYLYCCM
jgi:hypothetical protein